LATSPEKDSLRKVFLEKRDSISADLKKIASKKIQKNLKKISDFRNAQSIACYYPIGSEVLTQDIIQEALSEGKEVFLPKVDGQNIIFKKISDFKDVEKGSFDIMEPKDECPNATKIDVILVPTVGISPKGFRLGYGYGFYDRFLSKTNAKSIALTFSKQIVKTVPATDSDVRIDWIVTEDRCFESEKT